MYKSKMYDMREKEKNHKFQKKKEKHKESNLSNKVNYVTIMACVCVYTYIKIINFL